MKKQNLTFAAALIMSLFASSASASDFTPDASYLGASIGQNNKSVVGTTSTLPAGGAVDPTGFQQNVNLNIRAGAAWLIDSHITPEGVQKTFVGLEANVLALNSKLIALPTTVMVVEAIPGKLAVIPHLGFHTATGFSSGLDVAVPLDNQNALRAGVTKFNRSIEGGSHLIQIGLMHSF